MDNTEKNGVYVLAVIVALYQIKFPCRMRLFFALISFGMCMIVFKKFEESLLEALVIALSSDIYKRYVREPFEGFKEEMKETTDNLEKFKEDLDEKEEYINVTETYKENLGNLDLGTLEKMTSQTDKFMTQQKELMSVVEKLAPTLQQGMSMIQTFSNFKDSVSK
jgi:hypothetical protein